MKFSHLLSLVALSLTLTSSAQDVNADVDTDVEAQGRPGTPVTRLPLVDSKQLQRRISRRALFRHAQQLQRFAELSDRRPNRAFGSKGHNATVAWIKRLLDDTGYYDTYLETLPYQYAESDSQFSVVGGETYPTKSFFYAVSGNVTAPLYALDSFGCSADDFPEEVEGKLVLISRGECTYGFKVAYAGAAKAAGVIVHNDLDPELSGGSLGGVTRPEGPYVPVGSISGVAGRALRERLEAGEEIMGKLDAYGMVEQRYSSNLIATTKHGDKNNIVFSGAHSDSVPSGPGINDDGSGTIANLEIALQLTKFRVNNAVRFGWWTAEEFGLIGSAYHVRNLPSAEREKIALYLNFDMIASPNSGYLIYDGDGDTFNIPGPAGSAQIERLYEDFFKERELVSKPTNFSGRSDYGPFLEYGIPCGGLFTGAEGIKSREGAEWWGGDAGVAYDECYHMHSHSIATYARSLRGIPREPREVGIQSEKKLLHVDTLSYEERRHYGCNNHEVSWE
ncbi:LAP1 [Coprinopsis cinerea okayama7|uniref:Peptide hydrolase n=1 Tax=Coprinopsis cinerea (strain Okayama-7 / 130 / ATCC MYA-4618 / FGSC 9003) TaxID=240176 RepID=A8PFN5_COPC7|nr:LAP1 [Coprinopsis cinerea okayama7\|eukprot:XP_001841104.1 LAP1 [Coprinopsis cinerea okayama7\